MDDFEPYLRPLTDPAADGVPEVADADSHADAELDLSRSADGWDPVALPADRDDGPLGLDEYGVSSAERGRAERLTRRLRRERPDVGPADAVTDPGPRLADEALDAVRAAQVDADAEVFGSDEPVDPRLGSPVSMYDREVPGIPTLWRLGRLMAPTDGVSARVDPDASTRDAGVAGGGFTAEEAAMHEIPDTQLDPDADPDVDPEARAGAHELPPLGRTGAEQPWDPEDLAVAEGRDPTPANIEIARRHLRELGRAAIERTVP